MNHYRTIVVTGCIAPNANQRFLKLTSIVERKEQYFSSLLYLICESKVEKVIYCDGSGFSDQKMETTLFQAAEKNRKQFEWIGFQENEQLVIERGKGYGEGEIIDYALRNSKLIKNEDAFIKITGRLVVSNINAIIRNTDELNNYFIVNKYGTRGLDTRLYFCRKDFYNLHLRDIYKDVDDHYKHRRIEDLFFKEIVGNNLPFYGFSEYPFFCGVGGGSGIRYDEESYAANIVRSFLLKLGMYNRLYILRFRLIDLVKRFMQ